MFPYKLCQIKTIINSPARKVPSGYFRSFRNSSFIISTACDGVFYSRAKSENSWIAKLKKFAMLFYEPDKDHPSGEEGHEKILKEQQEQLKRLKKEQELKRESGDDDKFPKYTPK